VILVKVLAFGSNWWARFGRDPQDRYRFTRHAAYFNSTGLHCGRKIRRHWIVPGLIRFNGVGDFNPQFPNRHLGMIFECADLKFACGGNRLLFTRRAPQSATADYYLTVLSSERFGEFNFRGPDWKSDSVLPIAVSHLHAKQEAMLLMKPCDWVRNSLGIWRLNVTANGRSAPHWELLEDVMSGEEL
jgi:hypothetical protein